MSFADKPDGRVFASYPMPAKIDLINERPRRESQIEQQLGTQISSCNSATGAAPLAPKITIREQTTTTVVTREECCNDGPNQWEAAAQRASPMNEHHALTKRSASEQQVELGGPLQQQQQHQASNLAPTAQASHAPNQPFAHQNQHQQQQQQQQTVFTSHTINKTNAAALLAAELAEKEANLMREITALHQRPYSPFKTPEKIDLSSEQRVTQQQYREAPSPRLNSRNSSTRSTSADLLEKEAKLMQEIQEIESKPYNPQTMVVEREQWYEYPEGRPASRSAAESRRRVRDFCSLPPGLCQERHVHEENLRPESGLMARSPTPGSIHTTIIRSPKREIDNKSPLPFAFDNFTTKGVRGNIASVGAVEPDRPRPPIYPIVKRTPSPGFARL